jgi:hypothetical protein
MEARVTAHSQAFQLRERMQRAEVQHGQEIRADLPGIKVSAAASAWIGARPRGKGEVFFCNMGPIRVRKVTIAGDGRRLPDEAVVQGLDVAGDGTYDLLNALVRSNGKLQVIVDEVTQVVRRPRIREFAGTTG